MEMTPRMKAMADKHPKTVRELVKDIRSKKIVGNAMIADALEALDIHMQADFDLLVGMIDAKIRRASILGKLRYMYNNMLIFARLRIGNL